MSRISVSDAAIALVVSATLALSFLVVLAAPSHAQTLMQRNVSAAQAMAIVDGVIESCGRNGDLVTVTIAVVDRAGQPRLMLAGDTSAPSLEWATQTASDPSRAGQRNLVDVIPLGGGVPIMIGDEPIGGVGVSGAVGGQPADEACAFAGVAAIADQLQ
jgi:uncharacterized protein GlcG (DUF336 family)